MKAARNFEIAMLVIGALGIAVIFGVAWLL